jgi:thiol-disulfide isomerase/thioredoxin
MTGARSGFLRMGVAVAIVLPAVAISIQSVAAEAPRGFALHESPRPVPEIEFENGEGEAMSLADFKGSVVLLNIWATWCAPCRREMPTLDRLQATLGGPDFQVVALSIDRNGLPVVQEFYAELGLETLPIYVDQSGKAQRALSVLGVPTTLLLDREGNEIGRLLGPADWDSSEMVTFIRGHIQRHPGRLCARHRTSRLRPTTCGGRSQAQAWASPCLPVTGRHHLMLSKET